MSTYRIIAKIKYVNTNVKIKYIPMKDVLQKDDFIDGVHPNKNGHRKIFERIVDNIYESKFYD